MKHLKTLLFSLCFLASLAIFSSCGEPALKKGKEYTSAHICPMHCKGSGSNKAGNCPTCKMDYVANEDYKADSQNQEGGNQNGGEHKGHDHGSHEGHNHGSHEGHDHDSHEGHDHGSHEGHDHDSHEGHNH